MGFFFLMAIYFSISPQPEEKKKFDSVFDSLGPVGGILTGDKVKPVLLNSKLPVDILGRVRHTHTHNLLQLRLFSA